MDKKFMLDLLENGSVTVPTLLLSSYRDIGLNETECMILIQIHTFISRGNPFPTFDQLSERMTLNDTECADLLRHLVRSGYLSIVQKKDNEIYSEVYSLTPLWEKLTDMILSKESDREKAGTEKSLYTLFENEFGRPLSPIECETLAMWIDEDHHSPQMIKAALREAVISGKLNFRYIDRILFEWKKNGIRTLPEAKAHGERIRSHMQHRQSPRGNAEKKTPDMPTYDWLEKG